jgi:hypothetical protein
MRLTVYRIGIPGKSPLLIPNELWQSIGISSNSIAKEPRQDSTRCNTSRDLNPVIISQSTN